MLKLVYSNFSIYIVAGIEFVYLKLQFLLVYNLCGSIGYISESNYSFLTFTKYLTIPV